MRFGVASCARPGWTWDIRLGSGAACLRSPVSGILRRVGLGGSKRRRIRSKT
jgi:hypothetical protein